MPRKYDRRPIATAGRASHADETAPPPDLPRNLDAPARSVRVNLLVKSTLLAEARRYDVNLSDVLHAALHKHVRAVRRERWLAQHYPAIDTYNRHVAATVLLAESFWDE